MVDKPLHPYKRDRKRRVEFEFLETGERLTLTANRLIETLRRLIEAGERGLTSGEFSRAGWARRTAAYVRELRVRGVRIHTAYETAPDGSRIGRYRLVSKMVEVTREADDGE